MYVAGSTGAPPGDALLDGVELQRRAHACLDHRHVLVEVVRPVDWVPGLLGYITLTLIIAALLA